MSAANEALTHITDQNAAVVHAGLAIAQSIDRLTAAVTKSAEPTVLTVSLDGLDVDVVDLASRIEDALGKGSVRAL